MKAFCLGRHPNTCIHYTQCSHYGRAQPHLSMSSFKHFGSPSIIGGLRPIYMYFRESEREGGGRKGGRGRERSFSGNTAVIIWHTRSKSKPECKSVHLLATTAGKVYPATCDHLPQHQTKIEHIASSADTRFCSQEDGTLYVHVQKVPLI